MLWMVIDGVLDVKCRHYTHRIVLEAIVVVIVDVVVVAVCCVFVCCVVCGESQYARLYSCC